MSESACRSVSFRDGRFVDDGPDRILITILTCEKNRGRAEGVRNSWLRLLPESHRVLFVEGRPGEAERIEGDRLYLDCPESYETLPLKVQALLRHAATRLDFDYLFKTDDDTYLDLARFLAFDRAGADYIGQFREEPLREPGRMWHYGKCSDKSFEVPYARPFVCPWATGAGYFLSRKAAALAAARTAPVAAEHLFEDVMVGEAITPDPQLKTLRTRFDAMGVVNPLLPKDMLYLQGMVLERQALLAEVRGLRARVGDPELPSRQSAIDAPQE